MSTDFTGKFIDLSNLIQTEFDRNVAKYGDKIKCGRGCSECCSQIFRITPMDGFIMAEHIKTLPIERQAELKQKAEEYIKKLERPLPGEETDESETDKDKSNKDGTKIPCPALGTEGECTIYESRPIICRRFGIPLYDYKNPGSIHACHLNFKTGEEIIDDELIPNQTAIGMRWDELKDEYLSSIKGNEENFFTIAHSILRN